MTQAIVLSGAGGQNYCDALRAVLTLERPAVVGVAAAFVSIGGVKELVDILASCQTTKCRLVAGTDHFITHPQALYLACDSGWSVRFGVSQAGNSIFHPKLIIGGNRFEAQGSIKKLSCITVGSWNLTLGGLRNNVECGFIANGNDCLQSASTSFAGIWNTAVPVTATTLREYAQRFATQARQRPVKEIVDLGISDAATISTTSTDLQLQYPPRDQAVSSEFAIAAWTGLQSFTGEYRFQIEFPRQAGNVIHRLIAGHVQPRGQLDVFCPSDGRVYTMQYKYYTDNSMFRLNVPNTFPGVAWARANRNGLAVVEKGLPGNTLLQLRVLQPGTESQEVVGRSAALGSWNKTSTRAYGWF